VKRLSFLLALVVLSPAMGSGIEDLPRLGKPTLKRASTFDRTGQNRDKFELAPGVTGRLEIRGAGCIKHIWFTMRSDDKDYLRKVRLRMYWDGRKEAAVDCPFGDFFCLGHGEVNDIVSAAMCVSRAPHVESPPGQAAFNCYFPMPFTKGARIEVENRCTAPLILYVQIDYQVYDSPKALAGMGRFYTQYRSEKTVPPKSPGPNVTGEENYIILDFKGEGHYVGCNLSVDSKSADPGKWWEGDDMIFVDGEAWPPAIHGTGTEDYFNGAFGFRRAFNTPYYGCSYLRKRDGDGYFNGLFTAYRFHILDPIPFKRAIKVTVEHGAMNDAGNAFSSVAYYYAR